MKILLLLFLVFGLVSCDDSAKVELAEPELGQSTPQLDSPEEMEVEKPPVVSPEPRVEPPALSPAGLPLETVFLAGQAIQVEIAATDQSRHIGFMFRQEIPQGTGMLFVFDDFNYREFIMDNCLVDIDIVFIDNDGYIVHLAEMKRPSPGMASEIYFSQKRCRYALELPAGTIKELNLRINQTVKISDDNKYKYTR